MTSGVPEDRDPPPQPVPRGERSIDFGEALRKKAREGVRESKRLDAARAREAAAEKAFEPDPAAPRESLVLRQSGPVKHPPAAPRRPLRTRLLALALSVLCAIVIVEIGARILFPEPREIRGKPLGPMAFHESLRFPVPGEREVRPPYRLDKQLGFCLVSDFDAPQEFAEAPGGHYRLHTNAWGVRDERRLVPKDKGTLRILCVGDSMTFGLGVEREQAFPALLERSLGSELARPLDVVNAGVTCWGQREETAFLEHRGQDLEPDLVLLQFTVANDVLDNLRYQDGTADLVPDKTLGDDLSSHILFELPFADTSRVYRMIMWNYGRHAIRYRAMMEPWRLERTRALIRRARDAATALKAKFAVVVAPNTAEVDGNFSELLLRTHRIDDAILKGCAEDKIPALDTLGALRDARVRGKHVYFPKDMHWNAEGHETVARALTPWMLQLLRD